MEYSITGYSGFSSWPYTAINNKLVQVEGCCPPLPLGNNPATLSRKVLEAILAASALRLVRKDTGEYWLLLLCG
jgi:hypothetical protein